VTQRVAAHFIGIGGAGMSGLARVLHDRGELVSGSDLRLSRYASALRDEGVLIQIGHDAANVGPPYLRATLSSPRRAGVA
jgi:UDP-N-acetylmuramate--alanine ligase